MANPEGTLGEQLQDFVTVGGEFVIAGDVKARENEFLKMGVFGPVTAEIGGKPGAGNDATFAFLSDEGASFGAQSAAPLPLQYFLAGIAF